MLSLREYQKRPRQLADWLPWATLVAPGVVLNKDGSFQRSARFRGPDLDSASDTEMVSAMARVNNALRRLGSGWAVFVEAERRPAADYPVSDFPEPLSWLVDVERRSAFVADGSHFDSRYTLTLVYLAPAERQTRLANWFYAETSTAAVNWREQLAYFEAESTRWLSLLANVMPELAWLDDEATLTYLHDVVSTSHQAVAVPEVPIYLDTLLADRPLSTGLKPRLGDAHLRVVSVRGFPASTWPGLLDELNRLGFSYRWCTRFIALDKPEAERELLRLQRQWFAKRKGVMTLLRETLFQQESALLDSDADNQAADADAALQALGADEVAFGYVTATVVLLHENATTVDEQAQAVERTIQARGLITRVEGLNAVEAWLSSIPGQVYANVRQPLLSSLNLAHLLPLSAVWAGPEDNAHLQGPPLMLTRTDGATPFRLVTHIGDVGHTLIIGPTGMGKSVLLCTMILQFRRYAGSRVFVFDCGGSARATVLGLGGDHVDLGAVGLTEAAEGEGGDCGGVAFQPLADIDQAADKAWAADWLADLLRHEQVIVTPEVKATLWSALSNLATAPRHQRTLTGLSVLLQSRALREALQPYTLSGAHGRLLDAEQGRRSEASVQCVEMEALMQTPAVLQPVLAYLFHRIEQQLDGRPTLLILEEARLFIADPVFAARIHQWLQTLRKRNVSVLLVMHSLVEIQAASIASAIIESCPCRLFLPNPQALEPQLRRVYDSFGLNARQIELIARAEPKREYYYQSILGNRRFELGLGPVTRAFVTAATPADQRAITALLRRVPGADFAEAWLRQRELDWAADLLADFPEKPPEMQAGAQPASEETPS